jgi:hypothetical protein
MSACRNFSRSLELVAHIKPLLEDEFFIFWIGPTTSKDPLRAGSTIHRSYRELYGKENYCCTTSGVSLIVGVAVNHPSIVF